MWSEAKERWEELVGEEGGENVVKMLNKLINK